MRERAKSGGRLRKRQRIIHYSEDFLFHFYERLAADADSVSDSEFFRVHMHLLACDACLDAGKQCEDRARALVAPFPMATVGAAKMRTVGGA